MPRLQGHESIKLSADIGHAPGNHHPPGADRTLTTFMNMDNPQAGLALGRLRLTVGWLGTRCGPNGPLGVQAHSVPFGQRLDLGAGDERRQVLE